MGRLAAFAARDALMTWLERPNALQELRANPVLALGQMFAHAHLAIKLVCMWVGMGVAVATCVLNIVFAHPTLDRGHLRVCSDLFHAGHVHLNVNFRCIFPFLPLHSITGVSQRAGEQQLVGGGRRRGVSGAQTAGEPPLGVLARRHCLLRAGPVGR